MIVTEEFETKTGGRFDAFDVTEDAQQVVGESGVRNGTVLVFSPHTTCCVVVAEWGRQSVESLRTAMESLVPSDDYYAHDDLDVRTENLVEDEPPNAPAHIFHAILGRASECVPVRDGKIELGESQRILFLELDRSRPRRYLIQVVGE
ncbi:MAG: secondary thiamine-phosphate synthase enzyme YjbQ [Actinomycetota bacterium]|nr:secondary thiamine-phosphate synthase enzyme YjbQ [Actinomycetota bacterium]